MRYYATDAGLEAGTYDNNSQSTLMSQEDTVDPKKSAAHRADLSTQLKSTVATLVTGALYIPSMFGC